MKIQNPQDLAESGLVLGQPVHLGVVGAGQVADGIIYLGEVSDGIKVKFNGRVMDIRWRDIIEFWPNSMVDPSGVCSGRMVHVLFPWQQGEKPQWREVSRMSKEEVTFKADGRIDLTFRLSDLLEFHLWNYGWCIK
jgi:hypothetical protein